MKFLIMLLLALTASNVFAFDPLRHPVRSVKFWGAFKQKSFIEEAFPQRKRIHYYAPKSKQLDSSEAFEAYQKLGRTNFPTLYAATNPFDDFAESFVNYVHVVMLKKPWKVVVKTSIKTLTYNHCWSETRCAAKKALIENMIEK